MKPFRPYVVFALLLSACASGSPPASSASSAPASDPGEATTSSAPASESAESEREPITYGDMSQSRKSIEFTWSGEHSLPRREMGYEGEVDIRDIDGVELARLFEKRGQDPANQVPPEFRSLVGRQDAKFLLVDFEKHPAMAEELVFVFPPKTGVDFPDYLNKGFLVMLGVYWVKPEQNENLPEAPEPGDSELDIPSVSVAEVKEKMAAGDDFALFISSNGCGSVPPYRAILETSLQSPEVRGKLFDFPIEAEDEETYKTRAKFAETLIPRVVFPSLIVFRDGEPVDYQNGGRDYWKIQHAFARNELTDSVSDWVFEYTDETDNREYWLRGMAFHGNFSAGKLDGLDLSGLHLYGGTFAGASLENADLTDTVLVETSFAYADLTGANFEGATLTDVHWYKTICPDGKLSDEHGGACPVSTSSASD